MATTMAGKRFSLDNMEKVMKTKLALAQFNKALMTEYSFLKPKQIDCLRNIVNSDVIAILPTGYGKSLISEILPFISYYMCNKKSIVLVIAPLNAIIEQEVQKLGKIACAVTKCEPLREFSSKVTHYIGHPEDILFCAEQLSDFWKKVDMIFIVVDESHCVLDWGEDFRPDFRLLCNLRTFFPNSMHMLAVTATASKHAQKEIASLLGMRRFVPINTTPVLNDNVNLSVRPRISSVGGDNSVQEAYNFVFKPLLLQLYSSPSEFPLTIVYCKLQWCGYGIELAQRLLGISSTLSTTHLLPMVVQYHAQQPPEINSAIIQTLSEKNSSIKLVFSTIALGMGCDLRQVKRIIHAGPPSSLEVYTQEVGRAGRDGSKAEAVLYYNATDLAQKFVEDSLKQFCKNNETCRREFLSGYFDSQFSSLDSDCCDICGPGSSETFICKDEVKIPTLTQRQHLFDILNTYSLTDDTGLCQTSLDEHIINLITDTFEYVNTVEKIAKYFKQHGKSAESIFAIRKFVLTM